MELEQALTAKLATLTALPVYPQPRPQSAVLPVVEYRLTAMENPSNLDGWDGTSEAEVTLLIRSKHLQECEQHADLIRTGLPVIAGNWSGMTIDCAWYEDEVDSSEFLDVGSDEWAWQIEATYKVQY
jgi:hypothetical protein